MTDFYMIRHGEANYRPLEERKFIGHGLDLAALSDLGVQQIKATAQDPSIAACRVLLSSPYTRAMQSAAIIAKQLDLDIIVETDLHEWIPDQVTFNWRNSKEAESLFAAFKSRQGQGREPGDVWESNDEIRGRVLGVLQRYLHHRQVICVCHGQVISAMTGKENIKNGQIVVFSA